MESARMDAYRVDPRCVNSRARGRNLVEGFDMSDSSTTASPFLPAATVKTCGHCGEILPVERFSKDRRRRDGLHTYCKACFSSYNRARYERIGEKIRADVKRYRAENPLAVLATRLKLCAANPTQKNAYRAMDEAIKAGVMTRPEVCLGCGCGKDEHRIEAHHRAARCGSGGAVMTDPEEREPVDVDTICTGDCSDCPNGDEDGECTRPAQEHPSRDLPASECGGWERP